MKIEIRTKSCKYNGQFYIGQQINSLLIEDITLYDIFYSRNKYPTTGIKARCTKCKKEKIRQITHILNGKRGCSCNCKLENNPSWKGVGKIPGRYFNGLKKRAISRLMDFDLTIEYLSDLFDKQEGKCALSGRPIYFSEARKYKLETSASLDRIDNNKGYIKGNVQFVSKQLNFAKHKMDQADFIQLCKDVIKTHELKDKNEYN